MLQKWEKNKFENHSLLVCSSVVAVAVVAVHYTLWIYAQCGNNAKIIIIGDIEYTRPL